MPNPPLWMIYGAYGYTGRRIAVEARALGHRPILAGRDPRRLAELAGELGCEVRVFDLESLENVARHIADCMLVLNCAGPFSRTALPLVRACLHSGSHYLDITGEIDVIEALAGYHQEALCRGVGVIPAVGFDVVPTDAIAVALKKALPGAETLQLAFTSTGSLSPGTARTMWEVVRDGGRIRRKGRLRRVPLAWKSRRISFPHGKRWAALVPWGDVASAWYSTGIPNIEVYLAMPRSAIAVLKLARPMISAVASSMHGVQAESLIRSLLRLPPANHDSATRSIRQPQPPPASRQVELWGCVVDPLGRRRTATMVTPDGYDLTVRSAIAAVERILGGDAAAGFSTPTQAFGTGFAMSLPGVDFRLEAEPIAEQTPVSSDGRIL